jgi:hypothetical protein
MLRKYHRRAEGLGVPLAKLPAIPTGETANRDEVESWLFELERAASNRTDRKPLGKLARLVYEHLIKLPEHIAMTGPDILTWLASKGHITSDDTWFNEIRPALLPFGLQNVPRIGYYIPLSVRPIQI